MSQRPGDNVIVDDEYSIYLEPFREASYEQLKAILDVISYSWVHGGTRGPVNAVGVRQAFCNGERHLLARHVPDRHVRYLQRRLEQLNIPHTVEVEL